MTDQQRSQGGFTLIEVMVSLSIVAIMSVGLVAMIAQSQKLETSKREHGLVQSALFSKIQELRTLTTDEIRAQNGAAFSIRALPAVTPRATSAPANVGATFGDAPITPATGTLEIAEVDPNAPTTARAGSGYFSVTATATWTGIMGSASPQTVRISSHVVSHADD